ncbi:signal peptide peptidase SppA [Vaginella massiliensis]|uniref:signal peptide peptidase SppA n=1 Tax=Vaginella massiliensis TaxID=1816680 RepID=UPI00374FE494
MKNFFSRVFSTIVGNLLTFAILFAFLTVLILVSSIGSGTKNTIVPKAAILELTLDSPIMESEMDRTPLTLFNLSEEHTSYYLSDILDAIEAAATDDRIQGISLKVDNFQGGFTQADDIRLALENFKKSGKFVYAFSNNSSQISYYIMSIADKIYQNPLGMSMVQGLSAEIMFYKNFGDKYGIDFQVIRHGAYKSAVEPYLRDNLSEENKEQIINYVGDIWNNIATKTAKSRQLSLEQFNTKVDSLYAFNPDLAKKNKLVDELSQESAYNLMLIKKIDETVENVNEKTEKKYFTNLEDYILQLNKKKGKDVIAVLYASGGISEGDGFEGIQSETYIKAIQDIAENDKIKAVVLRINSPGGSANASEAILYELKQLRKKKPVVVSFGDVAASGGYYIAQSSERIFANANTITGSIGVLGMIPNAKKLANNIGITTDIVKTNANADQLKSWTNPMNDYTEITIQRSIEYIYHQFVNRIVENRNMTFEAVDKVGGGRVWSGSRAMQHGLVDEIGSLQDAINYTAKLINADRYKLESYPKRKQAFEEFMESLGGKTTKEALAQELGSEGYALYEQVKNIQNQRGAQLRLPFTMKIK